MAREMSECFLGSCTLGERGQIVIPSEARQWLGLKPGEKLFVLKHPFHEGIIVAKIDTMIEFFNDAASQLGALRDQHGEVTE